MASPCTASMRLGVSFSPYHVPHQYAALRRRLGSSKSLQNANTPLPNAAVLYFQILHFVCSLVHGCRYTRLRTRHFAFRLVRCGFFRKLFGERNEINSSGYPFAEHFRNSNTLQELSADWRTHHGTGRNIPPPSGSFLVHSTVPARWHTESNSARERTFSALPSSVSTHIESLTLATDSLCSSNTRPTLCTQPGTGTKPRDRISSLLRCSRLQKQLRRHGRGS